jgi:hypothetical protein
MSKMTAAFVTSAIALGALLSGAPSLDAQAFLSRNIPADGACFYRDVDFRGDFFCLRVGESTNSLPPGLNDEISSVRIFGRASVVVFVDAQFRGANVLLADNAPSLDSWNDRVSSIRVQARYNGGGGGGNQPVPANGACFYKDADFRGDSFCLSVFENSNAMPLGMNDEISSIRIFGRASVMVFEDEAFRGGSIQLNASVQNLAPRGWNDRISSLRVLNGGFGNDGGNGGRFGGGGGNGDGRPPVDGGGQVPRQGACFYTDAGFQGQRFCLARGQSAGMLPLGFNDEISSVQLYGGASVTIYEHEGFGGQSIGISNSMQNLSGARSPNGFAWNDQISSIRVN